MGIYKITLHRYIALILLCFTSFISLQALPLTHYATKSRLATGKWVKITIPQSGVYELTNDELSAMGFSDPSRVRIYGTGGYQLNEILNGNIPDDLSIIPVARFSNKICFYGKGTVRFTLTDPRTTTPHYTRTFNSYSDKGYYFITESDDDLLTINGTTATTTTGTTGRASSLDYFYHEKDLCSLSFSGKELLGEDMTNSDININYNLPQLCKDSAIIVNPCVATKDTTVSYIQTSLNGDVIKFNSITNKIYPSKTIYVFYNSATPVATIKPSKYSESGIVNISLDNSLGTPNSAKLDYLILTYFHSNTIPKNHNGQFRIGLNNLQSTQRVDLPNTPDDLVVWNIDNEQTPVRYNTNVATFTDTVSHDSIKGDSTVTYTIRNFTPGYDSRWSQFIAFDPADTLMKVTEYEAIDNQNLHGIAVPDMLIITNDKLNAQAQRVAEMHKTLDKIDVAVVNQDKIFNEFSSGVPDAMAYRLFTKMLYDRNSTKFKYLLLFGPGSYDNRKLIGNRENMILTYQSDCSNDEDYSYTNDDFFGTLDDNSGKSIVSESPTIAVGRIPSANYEEAVTDVDKLINYVTHPDYGDWRNNVTISADEGDYYLHAYQAEGIRGIFEDELKTGFNVNKVYVAQYLKTTDPGIDESRQTAINAKNRLAELFKSGQYFMTYIGHANSTAFTKTAHMWTISDVENTAYDHLPIVTTAACDVARFDCDTRGIAEYMFHKKDGGAIALVTSTRAVYAESNDIVNRAFIRGMLTYTSKDTMPTLGHAYLNSKLVFGTTKDYSKLSFMLMGDPAMKINYPKPYFTINSINGVKPSNTAITISPLTKLTVQADVMTADGSRVDTTFTGDATFSLYDASRFFTVATQRVNSIDKSIDIFYPRDLLATVKGTVVRGKFTGTMTVPRYCKAHNETAIIRVYAHKDNSTQMVNGESDDVVLSTFNDTVALTDTVAPTINSMYFNDEASFTNDSYVPSNSTLYIDVTDDNAVNTQQVGIGGRMTLILDDGSTTYPNINEYATVSNEGKEMSIAFPISDLKEGSHTLRYSVSDAAYNRASRSISFIVGPALKSSTLTVLQDPVIDHATFNFTTDMSGVPTVVLHVLDATGNVVYRSNIDSFPYTWDLKDSSGNKLPVGVYKYYATVKSGSNFGGTNMGQMIVVEPSKSK
jgi:hypothetical protein